MTTTPITTTTRLAKNQVIECLVEKALKGQCILSQHRPAGNRVRTNSWCVVLRALLLWCSMILSHRSLQITDNYGHYYYGLWIMNHESWMNYLKFMNLWIYESESLNHEWWIIWIMTLTLTDYYDSRSPLHLFAPNVTTREKRWWIARLLGLSATWKWLAQINPLVALCQFDHRNLLQGKASSVHQNQPRQNKSRVTNMQHAASVNQWKMNQSMKIRFDLIRFDLIQVQVLKFKKDDNDNDNLIDWLWRDNPWQWSMVIELLLLLLSIFNNIILILYNN